jgi:putative transcriptional regulator
MYMKERIENAVYQFRQNSNITQEELARMVGVSRQTIIAIEKGNYTPSVLLAVKLAKCFGTSVELLFFIKK